MKIPTPSIIKLSLSLTLLLLGGTLAYAATDPIQAPNSYAQTPASAIQAQRNSGVCLPRMHEYQFTNTSTNTSNIKFHTQIYGYAIAFDNDPNYTPPTPGNPAINDFLTNIDTTNLLCTDGGVDIDNDNMDEFTLQNCGFNKNNLNTTVYTGSEHGGTRTKYQRLPFIQGNPRGLLWEYGQTNSSYTNFPFLEAGETTYTGTVSFEAIDYLNDLQTATTEGWVRVKYFQQDTRGTASTSDDIWTLTYPIEVDANQNGNPDNSTWDPDGDHIFWWGIEDVNRSIWPDCDTPAPVCNDLDITSPTSISATNAGNTQPITIDVDDNTGAPWDGTYTYSSTNPTGFPTTCEFRKTGSLPWVSWQNSPYTTNSETVNVRNCSPAEIIHVSENSAPSVCNDNLAIGNACSDLTITSPTTIPVTNLNTPTRITIESDAASGGNNTWNGTYQYTSNSTCKFAATQVASQAGLGQGTVTTTRKIMWVNGCGENANVTVSEINYSGVCTDRFFTEVTPPPTTFCGDGIVQTPNDNGQIEICDDGNTNNNDLCRNDCTPPPPPLTTFCGDGIIQTPNDNGQIEICDDGNTNNNDLCRNDCTPPPPPVLVCENLTIREPISIAPENAGDLTTIVIETNNNEGNDWNGTYTYWSERGNCEFRTSESSPWSTSLETTAKSVEVQNCEPGDTIFVSENDFRTTCEDSLTIPLAPPNACTQLNINTPLSLNQTVIDSQPFKLSFDSLDINNENIPGIFEISATNVENGPSSCQFYSTEQRANLGEFGQSSMITTLHNVWVNGCNIGDTITIQDTQAEVCMDQISGTIIPPGPYCGDGTQDVGESCDNGDLNGTPGNVCSSTCTLPPPVIEQCIGLQIDPPSVARQGLPQIFNITSNPTTWPGPWTWENRKLNGELNGEFVYEEGLIGNPITTNDLSVVFLGGHENDTITVVNTNDATCNARANIIGNTGTCTTNCGGTPSTPGGNGTFCGDTEIQSPNDLGTDEVCDEGREGGRIDDNGPNDGLWCNSVCQVENACSEIIKINPTASTINYPPNSNKITFKVQAKDKQGDNWNDPAGLTYFWRVISPTNPSLTTGVFDDGATPQSSLNTNNTQITYTGNPNITTRITVSSPRFENSCQQTYQINRVQQEDTLEKKVTTYNFGFMEIGVSSINGSCFDSEEDCPTYAHDFDYALYELTYTPDPGNLIPVTITDDIKDGINGKEGGTIKFHEPIDPDSQNGDPLQIWEWTKHKRLSVFFNKPNEEEPIPVCERELNEAGELEIKTETPCYTGDIAIDQGVTLHNLVDETPIKIKYVGKVRNGNFSCKALTTDVCPVQGFKNTAQTNTGLTASADLTVICPYLLTRNAGDVYLGSGLQSYDLSCYYNNTQNSDGLVLARRSSFFKGFQSYINQIQTEVKEIVLNLQTVWKKTIIEETIQTRNAEAVTRYNQNLLNQHLGGIDSDGVRITNFTDLETLKPYKTSKQNVYEINGTDLIMALNGKIPSGATTFIVRNANLIIRKNIEYETIPLDNGQFEIQNPKDIPSIAFIVINGNIIVENNAQAKVTKMSGVYYVQGGPDAEGVIDGEWTDPFTKLEIQGSVYGNINPLLENRTFAGPANYDHGNVVIRYDERILLNTPPGLEDYVDIKSERVAR